MELVSVENVSVRRRRPASRHTENTSTNSARVTEPVSVENVRVRRRRRASILVNIVKIVQHVQASVRNSSLVSSVKSSSPENFTERWMNGVLTSVPSVLLCLRWLRRKKILFRMMRDCVHLLMTMTAGSPLSMATRMRLVSSRSGSRRPRRVQLWWTSWASSLVSLGPLWPLVSLSFSCGSFSQASTTGESSPSSRRRECWPNGTRERIQFSSKQLQHSKIQHMLENKQNTQLEIEELRTEMI